LVSGDERRALVERTGTSTFVFAFALNKYQCIHACHAIRVKEEARKNAYCNKKIRIY